MIEGTLLVTSSDDPRFVAGTSYPLSIDSSVDLTVVESVTATANVAPEAALPTAPASDTPVESA